ncbi:MAG: hypothetical protein JNL21_19155 [Myxococcales bacterium]|nr:hypothetical protein [Myxococcales bacterium]
MRGPSRVPTFFRSLRALRTLNVIALGASLAAATAAVFMNLFGTPAFGLIAGLPTFLYGMAWGVLLRRRATVGKSRVRWGWVASIPLAMANGALAGGLALSMEGQGSFLARFLGGGVLGATFGAVFWIPGLLATLAVFGLPVARSQRLADQGLAGEERGERIVGLASFLLALVAVFFTAAFPPSRHRSDVFVELGPLFTYVLGAIGLATGGAAALAAHYRGNRRLRFVEEVEAGKRAGFRVDPTKEGKVLVRVTTQGEGYRVADVEEEVLALDEAGEALRELDGQRAREP